MRISSLAIRCVAVCAGAALVCWALGQGQLAGLSWLRASQVLALLMGLAMFWTGALHKSPRANHRATWPQRLEDWLPALLAILVFALVLKPMLG